MSEDDRLAKIKDLLDAAVAQFESIFKSAGTFDESRVGNGWSPSNIRVQTFAVDAMPLDKAKQIAESRKSRLFGPLRFLRSRGVKIVGEPMLVFLSFWRVKGHHECFYFRGKTYKINVPDDVIAVQVGARIRPLTSEIKVKTSPLAKIVGATRRVLLTRPERRHFIADDATELAYQFTESSLLVDGNGKEDLSMEYLLEKKPQMRSLERREALKSDKPNAKFAPLTFSIEDVVSLLHARVVRPPIVFSKILTNRFEVTELQLFQVPIYVFRYSYLGRQKELRLHGVTGELLR